MMQPTDPSLPSVERNTLTDSMPVALSVLPRAMVDKLLAGESLIERALTEVCALVGTSHGFVDLVDAKREFLVNDISLGIFTRNQALPVRANEGLPGQVWHQATALLSDSHTAPYCRPVHAASLPVSVMAAAPMRVDGNVIGVMGLAHTDPRRTFSNDELDMLQRYADYAASVHRIDILVRSLRTQIGQQLVALNVLTDSATKVNATRVQLERRTVEFAAELSRRNSLLTALSDTTLDLIEQRDSSPLFEDVLHRATDLTQASHGVITVLNESEERMQRVCAMGGALRDKDYTLPGEGLVGLVWSTGEIRVIEHYGSSPVRLPEASQQIGAAVGVPMLINGRVIGVLCVARDGWQPAFSADEIDALERFARLAALIYRDADSRKAELRAARVSSGMREVLAAINTGHTVTNILKQVLHQAASLLEADIGGVFQINLEHTGLRLAGSLGLPEQTGSPALIEISPRLLERARRYPRHVLPDSVARVLLAGIEQNPLAGQVLGPFAACIEGCLAANLSIHGELYGSLILNRRNGRRFSNEDRELMSAFATQAALVIENALLRENAAHAAVLRERSRLAQELHDSVAQAIYSASLGAQVVARVARENPGDVELPVRHMLDMSEAALAEMRALVYQLRTDIRGDESLNSIVDTVARALRVRHRIDVSLTLSPFEPKLPPLAKDLLQSVLIERTHFLAHHGRATRISIGIAYTEERLRLTIHDDALVQAPREAGCAQSMHRLQQTIESVGGSTALTQSPLRGSLFTVQLPIVLVSLADQ
jgi:signal transduction histidine kinase